MRRKYEHDRENGERRSRPRKNQRQSTSTNIYSSSYPNISQLESSNGHSLRRGYSEEWAVEMYDQASSQSSTGGFSMGGPSPGPLTPNSQQVGSSSVYERVAPSPNDQESRTFPPYGGRGYPLQPSPVKLTPMDDATSDFDMGFYNSPGISPLKVNSRQFIKARVVPPTSSQNALVPVVNALSIGRTATPLILRRSAKTRRRRGSNEEDDVKGSGGSSESIEVLEPSHSELSVPSTSTVHEKLEDLDYILEAGKPTFSPMRHNGTTPAKQLPFSPSQFLNSPNITFDVNLSSTPMRKEEVETPTKDRSRLAFQSSSSQSKYRPRLRKRCPRRSSACSHRRATPPAPPPLSRRPWPTWRSGPAQSPVCPTLPPPGWKTSPRSCARTRTPPTVTATPAPWSISGPNRSRPSPVALPPPAPAAPAAPPQSASPSRTRPARLPTRCPPRPSWIPCG
ncbi:unnamed protein product [Callosobruchus maculatus]|uniref:Uncharacterized protein n=1 Tax=Callosobruchus maculatus TaxID=64391 RepID=A0A653D534_CALMS|nr:unnamed protein product [Callosobruchus maculatus]